MNFSLKIESLIPNTNRPHDLIFTKDWNGINSGAFLAKNTQWTKDFLRLAYAQTQFDNQGPDSDTKYPFEYGNEP